jgi:hypothetical protein
VRGVHGNVDGRASHRAVAEYQHPTLPCVRIRSFNIAGLARSNFKAGVDIDGRRAIIFNNPMKPTIVTLHIDVENVSKKKGELYVPLLMKRWRKKLCFSPTLL